MRLHNGSECFLVGAIRVRVSKLNEVCVALAVCRRYYFHHQVAFLELKIIVL
jgi:hypothetical protein